MMPQQHRKHKKNVDVDVGDIEQLGKQTNRRLEVVAGLVSAYLEWETGYCRMQPAQTEEGG
jgi:hypothetical protein